MYPNDNCDNCSPCPGTVTPLPLPDLTGLCGDEYNAACVIYTGEDITCLGIRAGMTFLDILDIFDNTLPDCGCCAPVDCVLSNWSAWSECECYYVGETLTCGRRTRTKTVITPASNGGVACGPLIEYEDCTVNSVCFTFGSDICGTEPLGTQITVAPSGMHDGKPYYSFTICTNPQSVWWSNVDDKWRISPSLGVADFPDFTLDNNDNYYPVSNTTTQLWNNPQDDTNYLDLIQSTLTTCPTYLICFHLQLTVGGRVYEFFNSIAAFNTPYDTYRHPKYSYVVDVLGTLHTITLLYNNTSYTVTSNVLGNIGLLNATSIYPVGTGVAGSLNPGSFMISSALGGTCTQPADVDCVWTCEEWGDCNASCMQTRVCTITTPASGNGTCDPSPSTQQSCCDPSCGQPISPIAVVVGANVQITFTAISGATNYTLTYNYPGGTATSLVSSSPSFSFPWVCGVIYTGTVVTTCALLDSEPTPFTIQIPDCPQPEACNGEITNLIAGTFESPQETLLKINISTGAIESAFPVINSTPGSGNYNFPTFWTSELCNDGLFLAGKTPVSLADEAGFFISGGIVKLNCSSRTGTAYTTINRTFLTSTLGGVGFAVNSANLAVGVVPVIRSIKYDSASNRLYVGGRFDMYKGANCSKNLVCLDATTGAIISSSTFKIGVGGLPGSSNFHQGVYDIQIDGNGKIVVGGLFNSISSILNVATPAHNILRLNTDGTLDPTFVVSGTSFSALQTTRANSSNRYSLVKTVHIDSNNDIYAGGAFYTYKGITANHIVKIKNNGSIAPTLEFNSGSGFLLDGVNSGWKKVIFSTEASQYSEGDFAVSIEKIVPHINGLLITGNFGMYNTSRVNALVKINTNGTVDTSFTVDTSSIWVKSLNDTFYRSGMDIKVLNDNRVLFGGVLNNYLLTGTNSYYVLNVNGTVNIGSTTIGINTDPIMVKTIADYFM
jgi:hypothetical protein